MNFQRNTNASSYKKVSVVQTFPKYKHVYKIMMIVDSKEAKQKKIVRQLLILEILPFKNSVHLVPPLATQVKQQLKETLICGTSVSDI